MPETNEQMAARLDELAARIDWTHDGKRLQAAAAALRCINTLAAENARLRGALVEYHEFLEGFLRHLGSEAITAQAQELLDLGRSALAAPATTEWLAAHDAEVRRAALEEADRLISAFITVRSQNTPEWMDGLVEDINRYQAAVGEEDRVARHGDGLRIVKGAAAQPTGKDGGQGEGKEKQ